MPNPPTTQILETLIIAVHRLTRIAALETGNTTPVPVWRTLAILTSDGPMRTGELARRSRISQPGMTNILHEMVADQLVDKIADAEDARASLIAITPRGAEALGAWRTQLASALDPMFGALTPDEWATLDRAGQMLVARTEDQGHIA